MPYIDPGLGEDFGLRVIFKLDGPIPLRWAVTHEFSTNIGGSSSNIDDFATSMMGFHQKLLLEPYEIEKAVVSTLAADGSPYNPETFKVYDGLGFGTKDPDGADVYDLNNVLVCTRAVEFGRQGHMFLRGFLTEAEVTSVGGRVALLSQTNTDSVVQAAYTSSGIDSFVAGGATDVQLYMITLGLVDNSERAIQGFKAIRLGQKKLNNKWFNRS